MNKKRSKELFTLDQRKKFMAIPEDYEQLRTYYTFSNEDLENINTHRRNDNKLGFAVQLAVLRYPGWALSAYSEISPQLINYIAEQLNIEPKLFYIYPNRENTFWEHFLEIKKIYGYSSFSEKIKNELIDYMIQIAMKNEDTLYLFFEIIAFLKSRKIPFPAVITLEKIISDIKEKTEEKIFNLVTDSLSSGIKLKLNRILIDSSDVNSNLTIFGWLKQPIGFPSPKAFLSVAEKIEYLRLFNFETTTIKTYPSNILHLAKCR